MSSVHVRCTRTRTVERTELQTPYRATKVQSTDYESTFVLSYESKVLSYESTTTFVPSKIKLLGTSSTSTVWHNYTSMIQYCTTLIQLHARVRVHVQLQTVVHVGNNILYHTKYFRKYFRKYYSTGLRPLSRELAWIDGAQRVEPFGFISPLTLSHQR